MITSFSLYSIKLHLQCSQVTREHRVPLTDEASGSSVLQIVVLGEQRDDLWEDGFAHQLSLLVFGHNTWPHLDLLTHLDTQRKAEQSKAFVTSHCFKSPIMYWWIHSYLEYTLKDTSSGHTSFQVVDLTAGFVHIKGSNDWNTKHRTLKQNSKHLHKRINVCVFTRLTNESGLGCEISDGHGDHFDDVLTNHLDVVLQLGWDGNDGSALGHCACRRNIKSIFTSEFI